MSAIDTLFQNLRNTNQKAFMPFITAGDPDLEFTADLIRRLVSAGAHMCEVGVPYSDPIADGPVIQASYTRALDRKTHVDGVLDMLARVSPDVPDAPLVTMVSYAIIYRYGPQAYVERAKAAGVSGLIVPDLPVEESGLLSGLCRDADVSLIPLIAPTTPQDRAKKIAAAATGFIYYVSIAGTTGARTELPPEIVDNVAWLKKQTDAPVCIGFGISRPGHVRMLSPVADGLIVGSAIVRRVAEAESKSREEVLADVETYVKELVAALGE